MDSASENEELSANFLGETHQYLVASEDTEDSRDGEDSERSNVVLREQDRFLPIANVARLMKKSIPKTGKIAKDARECVQECVSEFVSFITSEASDRCHQEKRKTINGEDILFAMSSLGFDNYVEPLKQYLQKYREAMKGDKSLSMAESFQITNLNGEVTEELLQQQQQHQQQQQQQQDVQAQGSTTTTTTATTELESDGVIFTYAPVTTDTLSTNNDFNIV